MHDTNPDGTTIGDTIADHTDEQSDQPDTTITTNGRFTRVNGRTRDAIERWVYESYANLSAVDDDEEWCYDAETDDGRCVTIVTAQTRHNGRDHPGAIDIHRDRHAAFHAASSAGWYLLVLYNWLCDDLVHVVDTARVTTAEMDDILDATDITGTVAHVPWPRIPGLDVQSVNDREQAVRRLYTAVDGCADQQLYIDEMQGFRRLSDLLADRDHGGEDR